MRQFNSLSFEVTNVLKTNKSITLSFACISRIKPNDGTSYRVIHCLQIQENVSKKKLFEAKIMVHTTFVQNKNN